MRRLSSSKRDQLCCPLTSLGSQDTLRIQDRICHPLIKSLTSKFTRRRVLIQKLSTKTTSSGHLGFTKSATYQLSLRLNFWSSKTCKFGKKNMCWPWLNWFWLRQQETRPLMSRFNFGPVPVHYANSMVRLTRSCTNVTAMMSKPI